jgi:hypothetical protein
MDDSNKDEMSSKPLDGGETDGAGELENSSIHQNEAKRDIGRRALVRSGWAVPLILAADLASPAHVLAVSGSGAHSDADHVDEILGDLSHGGTGEHLDFEI